MAKGPSLVPSKSGGASRRAYQGAFNKGMSEKGMGSLGKLKLKTPALKGGKRNVSSTTRDYAKKSDNDPMNVSFGDTGYTEEDYEE